MKFLRYFLPFAILAICGYVTWQLLLERPEPTRWNREPPAPEVQVQELQREDYQILLQSQGIVEPRTQSALIPEVRGRIIEVSPNFRPGGFFEKGELLVQIDASDYETDLVVAEATLAQMELRYAEEKVRSNRAELDWTRLGNEGEAPELVLRRPQMREAEAQLASAGARLKTARLNLERTLITAPYAGRILKKNVDVGQYVSPGNQLATLYAIDFAEIRLPLSESQLGFIDLPESYRGAEAKLSKEVELSVSSGDSVTSWKANLVRAEGAFDLRSRQLYVVAQIPDPYGNRPDGRPPLKVGSFAEATIPGDLLRDVFVIPRRLFRESDHVILVDETNRLVRRSVQPIWSDAENIVVRDQLDAGERLCITPIRYATSGMRVKLKADGDEAIAEAKAQFERFEEVMAHIPADTVLPLYLDIQVKSLQDDRKLERAGDLVIELLRWARQSGIALPASLYDADYRKERQGLKGTGKKSTAPIAK